MIDVKALEIRDYAISREWKLVNEAIKDGWFVLNSPENDFTQLIFPIDDIDNKYEEMASVSLKRLAEHYNIPLRTLTEEIREVNDDVISLRYFSAENKIVNSISFQEALEAIDATKQMLLAATSSVVNPVTFHPKLNRVEAQELLKNARFRHTEEGSFVLKVSVPFELGHPTTDVLFDDQLEKPLSRKSLELIYNASDMLLSSINSDTIAELFREQSTAEVPIISYNFCDAVSKLFDEERELPFELRFSWSKASLSKLKPINTRRRIIFPFTRKNKIEEVREYFARQKKEEHSIFIATVETLDGATGEDGRRQGQVILSVLYENDLIKARVHLNSDFYLVAIDAHKKGNAYVELEGTLKQSKRTFTIENVSSFKFLMHKV